MKKIKYIFCALLCLQSLSLFALRTIDVTITDTTKLFQDLAALEHLFEENEATLPMDYEEFTMTLASLTDQYNKLVMLDQVAPSSALKENIEHLRRIFIYIRKYIDKLMELSGIRNKSRPLAQAAGEMDTMLQTQQQQLLMGMMNMMQEQYNQTMERINAPKRWFWIKLIAGLAVGAISVATIVTVIIILYNHLNPAPSREGIERTEKMETETGHLIKQHGRLKSGIRGVRGELGDTKDKVSDVASDVGSMIPLLNKIIENLSEEKEAQTNILIGQMRTLQRKIRSMLRKISRMQQKTRSVQRKNRTLYGLVLKLVLEIQEIKRRLGIQQRRPPLISRYSADEDEYEGEMSE